MTISPIGVENFVVEAPEKFLGAESDLYEAVWPKTSNGSGYIKTKVDVTMT